MILIRSAGAFGRLCVDFPTRCSLLRWVPTVLLLWSAFRARSITAFHIFVQLIPRFSFSFVLAAFLLGVLLPADSLLRPLPLPRLILLLLPAIVRVTLPLLPVAFCSHDAWSLLPGD